MKEREQYLGMLKELKAYDEKLTPELAAKANQEQEKRRLEVQFTSLFLACTVNGSSHVCWELAGLLRSPCVPCAFPLLMCITVKSMTSPIVIT